MLRRAAVLLAAGALALTGCAAGEGQEAAGEGDPGAAASSAGETVKIATGVDVQTRVLAHLYQQRLEESGTPATVVDVGRSRDEIFAALRDGRATMVPDFTGDLYVHARRDTLPGGPRPTSRPVPMPSSVVESEAPRGLLDSLGQFLGITGETGPSDDDVYRALPQVLPKGLEVLDSSPAQRTDRMVVTAATDAQYSLGDMNSAGKQCGKLSVGMPSGYADSAQGPRGLKAYYRCSPRSAPEYGSTDELVDALLQDKVQAAVFKSSEPVIQDEGLVVLDDPDRLFRPEREVVLSSETLSDKATASVNAVSADLSSEDLSTIIRLAGGEHPAMSPEKTAAYVRDRPR